MHITLQYVQHQHKIHKLRRLGHIALSSDFACTDLYENGDVQCTYIFLIQFEDEGMNVCVSLIMSAA